MPLGLFKILYPANLDPTEHPFDNPPMARAWIELPYDPELGKVPWGKGQWIISAVKRLGYRAERHVAPGSGEEWIVVTASGDMKKP